MAIRDILVHLDGTANSRARLDLAIGLARRHGARLTGIYVITHQYYQPEEARANREAAELGADFESRAGQAGIESTWLAVDWAVIGVTVTEVLSHYTHYADLVVVGQSCSESEKAGIPADLPERLVMGAGRPVLVVPFAGAFHTVGERVLVAWKPGRESTRAVNDALPILKKARQVKLLGVNASGSYGDDESLYVNIRDHLERHGVSAGIERVTADDISVGDMLLNRACEEGADLLVMGAFAHTPQGTLVLGAVARHLLKHMTVPVLLSH